MDTVKTILIPEDNKNQQRKSDLFDKSSLYRVAAKLESARIYRVAAKLESVRINRHCIQLTQSPTFFFIRTPGR